MTRQLVLNEELASNVARANLLTNGGFEIWQRGTGPFTAHGVYTADRWMTYIAGSSTMSVSRISLAGGPLGGISYGAQLVLTWNNGDCMLYQNVPVWPDFPGLRGRRVSFSIRAHTSSFALNAQIASDGAGGTILYGDSHPGDQTWRTLKVQNYLVPADATYLQVRLYFTASTTAYFDEAMFVVGPVASDFLPLHPADDLARCLRYYERHGEAGQWPSIYFYAAAASAPMRASIPWGAKKAVTPTVTKAGTWYASNTSQPVIAGGSSIHGYLLDTTAVGPGPANVLVNASTDYIAAEANP